jgi:hypothetical protein
MPLKQTYPDTAIQCYTMHMGMTAAVNTRRDKVRLRRSDSRVILSSEDLRILAEDLRSLANRLDRGELCT